MKFYKNALKCCRSCWAHAAKDVIDAAYAIFKNQTISVSRNHLINCTYGGKINASLNQGCDGGNQATAFGFVQQHGLSVESLYPYTYVNKAENTGAVIKLAYFKCKQSNH